MPYDRLGYKLQEKWDNVKERLRLPEAREWVNRHPEFILTTAIISGLVLLTIVIRLLIPDKPAAVVVIEKEWYYDLNTGKLFTAAKDLTPPIEAPSGPQPDGEPAGVRAYLLAYSQEAPESERFIGFLETSAPAGVQARWPTRPARPSAATDWGRGKFIRRTDDEHWVPADSRQGQQIFAEAFAPNADGERPIYCRPK